MKFLTIFFFFNWEVRSLFQIYIPRLLRKLTLIIWIRLRLRLRWLFAKIWLILIFCKNYLKRPSHRWLLLILSAAVGLGVTVCVIWGIYLNVNEGAGTAISIWQFLYSRDESGEITGFLTNDTIKYYLAFGVGIGPSFVIWFFRDQNKLWEIENSRKDTNLKDFQQLQQWATGHFPKASEGNNTGDKPSTTDKNQTDSDALQLSAIYQLGAFFRGEFGEQFRRPAYEILYSIWVKLLSVVDEELKNVDTSEGLMESDIEKFTHNIEIKKSKFHENSNMPIAMAIIDAVFGDGGKSIQRLNKLIKATSPSYGGILQNRDWRGIHGISNLDLSKLNLERINLSYVDIKNANLSRSDLNVANLSGANLIEVNLSRADLSYADLSKSILFSANLSKSELSEANFSESHLFYANLSRANLSRANLSRANLSRANLSMANLNKTNLFKAVLSNANLVGTKIGYARLINVKFVGGYVIVRKLKNADSSIIGYWYHDKDDNTIFDRNNSNKLRKLLGLNELPVDREPELPKEFEDELPSKSKYSDYINRFGIQ